MIENIEFSRSDNYNNSLYEEYILEYDLYLAETDTFNTLNRIDNEIIQESQYNDTEILNESIKETLTVWIGRFTEALQKALTKFMAVIEGQQDLAYLKSIDSRVRTLATDPGFTVSNLREYKSDSIRNFKVIPFMDVYNANKDSLQSQEQFLAQNYSSYGFTTGNSNIKEVLETAIVDVTPQPQDCTVEMIKTYYNWCRNEYLEDIKPIQDQMRYYNDSIKSISTLVSQLPDDYKNGAETNGNPDVTPTPAQQGNVNQNVSSAYIFSAGAVLTEADPNAGGIPNNGTPNNQKGSSNPGKMTFDNKVDYVAKVGGGNQEAVNAIKTYLSCTTRLLSSMMMIVKNRKADYMRVLKHLFPVNREMRDVAQSTVNINRANQVPQINIPQSQNQQI